MTNIKEQFDADKAKLLSQTTKYLKNNISAQDISPELISQYRNEAIDQVKEGNFNSALQTLEKLRDAKSGIVLHEIKPEDGASTSPIIIRDARKCKNPSVRETESFEMQYLNAIRAGMDMSDIEKKPELKDALQKKAAEFITNFHKDDQKQNKLEDQENYQKILRQKLQGEIANIAALLEQNGIKSSYKKLNIAKDFQNFNDTPANVVTISSIKGAGVQHTIVEAEVALKGLTDEQLGDYEAIRSEDTKKPKWYTKMPSWEQDLCRKYVEQIIDGKHVIPTQLRQIVGMKNAFEKTTAIFDTESKKLELLHTSKHAGSLASLARDKSSRQDITNKNARQAQEWIGENRKLHCNTFNSGPIGAGDDPEIVKRTTTAMQQVGGRETNTAFNDFRFLGVSNDLTGVKKSLEAIAKGLDNDPDFNAVKSYIKPRGFFSRLFGINVPKGNVAETEIEKLLKSNKINEATAEILKSAINLRKEVEQADVWIRFGDRENVSLKVSTQLNNLTNQIVKADDKAKANPEIEATKGLNRTNLVEEILNMCASGKDRTGLAEHDQSATAIAKKTKIPVEQIDAQLISAGHTAQQAGGVYAGGATIGCYGTKKENKAGLPQSRKEGLLNIIEVSAASNKIKEDKNIKPAEHGQTITSSPKVGGGQPLNERISQSTKRTQSSRPLRPIKSPDGRGQQNQPTSRAP